MLVLGDLLNILLVYIDPINPTFPSWGHDCGKSNSKGVM